MKLVILWPWPLTFELQNSITSKVSQGHSFPMPSLNTLGSFVFELCSRQTDKQTDSNILHIRRPTESCTSWAFHSSVTYLWARRSPWRESLAGRRRCRAESRTRRRREARTRFLWWTVCRPASRAGSKGSTPVHADTHISRSTIRCVARSQTQWMMILLPLAVRRQWRLQLRGTRARD